MGSNRNRNRELVKLARNHYVPASITDVAIHDFLEALDCPKSLAISILYKHQEYQQLVDMELEPLDYNDPFSFRDAYTAFSFLSKADFFKLAVSKEEAAFKKFFKFEELCKQTNSRFMNLNLDPNYHGPNVWLLNATKRKIEEILGDFSPEEFVDEANWGPGVTTLLKGEHVSAINKFHSENGITRDLYALVGSWFPAAYPQWYERLTGESQENPFAFVVGNEIVTVPKNSKTDRVIASEPGLNLWFQKAIGNMIRRRLRRWGIDLNSQDRNQLLAKLSSIDDSLATVDFSSASDSIARKLVEELIPPRWLQLLSACRCSLGAHNGTFIRWEKFSSMGNGFTFELESLIFFAAALAVKEYLKTSGTISVFGDDVILPKHCYELFSSFTAFLGFQVNKEKSFSTSYFRESCGAHYFDGIDCKPIYLKKRVRNVSAIYKLANSVRYLAHRRNSHYGCDARFRNCWRHLRKRIPKPLRFGITLGIGDGGLIGNFDETTPVKARHGLEGYRVKSFAEIGVTQSFDGPATMLARLKARPVSRYEATHDWKTPTSTKKAIADLICPSEEGGNDYTLRGRTKLAVSMVHVQQWYNLGPWL